MANHTSAAAKVVRTRNRPGRTDRLHLELSKIDVDPDYNTRYDLGSLEEMAHLIAENGGILHDVTCWYSQSLRKYFIKSGHRRVLGAKHGVKIGLLDEQTLRVPVKIVAKGSDADMAIDIIIDNDGKPLTMLELAYTYKKAMEAGSTIDNIRQKTRHSLVHIKNCLRLLTLTPAVIDMIKSGSVAPTLIVGMFKEKKTPQQIEEELTTAIQQVRSKKIKDGVQLSLKDNQGDKKSGDLPPAGPTNHGGVVYQKRREASEYDGEFRLPDNTKTTGKSGKDLPGESGPAIKITAKNLAKKNLPEKPSASPALPPEDIKFDPLAHPVIDSSISHGSFVSLNNEAPTLPEKYSKQQILDLLLANGVSEDEQAYQILFQHLN